VKQHDRPLFCAAYTAALRLGYQSIDLHGGCLCTAGLPCSTFQHTLVLQLDGMTGAVQTVELQPEEFDIQDIGRAALAARQGPSFVVRPLLNVK